MFTLFIVLHVIFCIFLILVILLQTGKGAGIGAAFGGGSQTVFGPRGAGSFIGKITGVVAGLFMLTSMVLAYQSTSQSGIVADRASALQPHKAEAVENVDLNQNDGTDKADTGTTKEETADAGVVEKADGKSAAETTGTDKDATEQSADEAAPKSPNDGEAAKPEVVESDTPKKKGSVAKTDKPVKPTKAAKKVAPAATGKPAKDDDAPAAAPKPAATAKPKPAATAEPKPAAPVEPKPAPATAAQPNAPAAQ